MKRDKESIAKMVSIAQMYYLGNLPRSEIANRLGISRQLVSKLLTEAQNEGLIEIRIIDPYEQDRELGHKLAELTGLQEVIIVPASNNDSLNIIRNIGAAAADYLQQNLGTDMVIGLSWGRTMSEMVNSLDENINLNSHIVPLIGGLGRVEPHLQVNNIVMQFSLKSESTAHMLYTPAIVESESTFQDLLASSKTVLDYWDQLDVAVVGIGVPGIQMITENVTKLNSSQLERIEMQSRGAVGDIGLRYYTLYGKEVVTDVHKISIELSALKKTKLVLGIAGGLEKTDAIIGAINGGFINALITDEYVAQDLFSHFSRK